MFLIAAICCFHKNLICSVAGSTAYGVKQREPARLITCQSVTQGFEISFRHKLFDFQSHFFYFFLWNVNVILIESISNSRNSIFCKGTRKDFCKFITKPRLCNRKIHVYLAISIYSLIFITIYSLTRQQHDIQINNYFGLNPPQNCNENL